MTFRLPIAAALSCAAVALWLRYLRLAPWPYLVAVVVLLGMAAVLLRRLVRAPVLAFPTCCTTCGRALGRASLASGPACAECHRPLRSGG